MHIVLADRGIDLGGLNPFPWKRRRAWRRKFVGNPNFTLQDPLEVASLPVVATDLLGSGAYLPGDMRAFQEQLAAFLANARERLSPAQAQSVISMMESIAGSSGNASEQQKSLIAATRERLDPVPEPKGTWR